MNDKTVRDTHLSVDFETLLAFTFNGKSYTGYQGDSIASALYRAGVRIFSRSFKYHRPRGLMTLDGTSPNDLVEVDGIPNVHASITPLKAGMRVRGQNAWPSVRFDLMGILDKLGALLPVGFYYKAFYRPRLLWPLYEKILRRAAGLGRIDPDPQNFEEPYFDKAYAKAGVAVVGGGPAGMAAALAAANLGAQVILIEKEPGLGGHLRYSEFEFQFTDAISLPIVGDANLDTSSALTDHLASTVIAHPKINVLTSATAFGWYEGNYIGVALGNRLIKLRADQLIVAAGRIEQPLVFENNDLPGILLSSGLQRLINIYRIKPGKVAVVVTTNDQGWLIGRDLLGHGVKVAVVADARPEMTDTSIANQLREAGVPIKLGWTIKKAFGRKNVRGAQLIPVSGNRKPITLDCDLISISGGFSSNNALLYQSGCDIRYESAIDDFIPENFPAGVWGAGHAVGTRELEAVLLEGYATGMEAASLVGCQDVEGMLPEINMRLEQLKVDDHFENQRDVTLKNARSEGKTFLCFCEDVTAKDARDAVAEGFSDIQTLKRYSTISMGPCQGKICSKNAIKLLAKFTKRGAAETGTTTSRPAFMPVELGTLAGRQLTPFRVTPVQSVHARMNAAMMNAGQWKRPEHYGEPEDEVIAVRQRVGIIDVSTLGKIEVRGPDAGEFLERIYTGRMAGLIPGRLKYGLMCTEEGVILDDGLVGCLGDNHFYLTTTSGGSQSIFEWLTWWATAWHLEVHISDQTACYTAVNVAGPRVRSLLSQMTDMDLSNQSFPYMRLRTAVVAGVPTRLMRIGFVGELGYEIHVPAEYGLHLWEKIMETGAEFEIAPFAVEAQRVLRLEKGHLIVGQDTDALSDPFGAGLGWAVRLDKPDFIGKPSLLRRKENPAGEQLIGFEIRDSRLVAGEGEQFVDAGILIGRVTSARYSPTLKKSIGLGWVKSDYAAIGNTLTLRNKGQFVHVDIVKVPFYDPEGKLLRG